LDRVVEGLVFERLVGLGPQLIGGDGRLLAGAGDQRRAERDRENNRAKRHRAPLEQGPVGVKPHEPSIEPPPRRGPARLKRRASPANARAWQISSGCGGRRGWWS